MGRAAVGTGNLGSPLVSCSKRDGASFHFTERREGSEVSTAWTIRKKEDKEFCFLNMEGTALWLLGLAVSSNSSRSSTYSGPLPCKSNRTPLLGNYLTFTVSVSRDCFQEAAATHAPEAGAAFSCCPRAQEDLTSSGETWLPHHVNLASSAPRPPRWCVKWGQHLLKDPA